MDQFFHYDQWLAFMLAYFPGQVFTWQDEDEQAIEYILAYRWK